MAQLFNKMIKPQHLIIFFLCLFMSLEAYSDCSDNLESANKLYEQGKFDEAIDLILPCSESEVSGEQWQVYKLLTKAYLGKQSIAEARAAAVHMLELNPTYQVNPRYDSKDLISLLKSINVIPKFSLGLTVMYGPNITLPRAINSYAPSAYEKTYSSKTGFQLGLVTGYNLNMNHGVDFNIIYNVKSYHINYDWSGDSYDVSETLNYFDFPLMYRYSFTTTKQFRLSVLAGPYASILVNSYNDITLKGGSEMSELTHYGSTIRRNKATVGGLVGLAGSLKTKRGGGHVSFDLRYNRSFSNITKESTRYDNTTLLYDYSFLDDDIQLDYVSFSVGYHFYVKYQVPK